MNNAPWRLIGFELLSPQSQQSARYLPAKAFGANFKLSNQLWRTLYKLGKDLEGGVRGLLKIILAFTYNEEKNS
jgi:hypothetical protein